MIGFKLSVNDAEWVEELDKLDMDQRMKLAMMLVTVGHETVAYLRSLTPHMRPPARTGEGERAAHPGGWADITGQLALSYRFEVWVGSSRLVYLDEYETRGSIPATLPPGRVKLVMLNDAEYAADMEERDGYWVLSGVTAPGAPLEKAVRQAAERLGWRVL